MGDESADDTLRELAQHRGLKLVKSRRRKPGVGDFGKFGLTDSAGKPLLGIGEDRLTATAADVEDYLHAGATGTWRQSADALPDKPATKEKPAVPESDDDPSPGKRKRGSAAAVTRAATAAPAEVAKHNAAREAPGGAVAKPSLKPEPKPAPEPQPEPELAVRAAKPADAEALAHLLGALTGVTIESDGVAANLASLRKAGGGTLIAERDEIIGCCSWTVISTLHRGRIGRITSIVVSQKRRRQGIGAKLLGAALAELAKAKCDRVEVISDIDLKNSHNFFRSTGFEQASYRFTRTIE